MTATTITDQVPAAPTEAVVPSWVIRVAAGAGVAAVLDAAAAFVLYVLIAHRYNFETLLQYIATGVTSHAFRSGGAGIGTAALGFAIHGALAAGFAVGYAVALKPLSRSLPGAVVSGLLYGAVVWVVMAGAVLPILHVAHEPAGGRYWWAFLADHALFVGVPIAVAASMPAVRTRR
jgi:hypothetical protein